MVGLKVHIKNHGFTVAIFLAIFLLYIYTLYGIGGRVNFGDSVKWQFIFDTDYITHPTGYPLYLILSKVFNKILFFIDSQAVRINLMSTFFSLLALFFTYKNAHLLIQNRIFSTFPVLIMATTFSFWSQSTEAEVYTLNAFFFSFVLYNFLKFYKEKSIKNLYLGIIFYAVSFGNHLSMIFLLPALLYILYITDKSIFRNLKVWTFSVFSIILGASQYLYVWERFKKYYNQENISIWGEGEVFNSIKDKNIYEAFLTYITGGQFKGTFFQGFNQNLLFFPKIFGSEFFLNLDNFLGYTITFTLIITMLTFMFVGIFYVKKQKILRVFYIVILSYGFFIFGYPISDINVYFIPVYLILFSLLSFLSYRFFIEKKFLFSFLTVFPFIFLSLHNLFYIPDMKKYDYRLINYSKFLLEGLWDKKTYIFDPIYGSKSGNNYHLAMLFEYSNHTGDLFKCKIISLQDVLNNRYNEFYILRYNLTQEVANLLKDYYDFVPLKSYIPLKDVINNYKDYTILMSVYGDGYYTLINDLQTYNTLKLLGASFKDLCFGSSYILIIRNGKVVKEVSDTQNSVSVSLALLKDKSLWSYDYKNNAVFIDITSSGYGKNCKEPDKKERSGIYFANKGILINDEPVFLEFEGLHVLVLDKQLKPIFYNIYAKGNSLRDIYIAKLKGSSK